MSDAQVIFTVLVYLLGDRQVASKVWTQLSSTNANPSELNDLSLLREAFRIADPYLQARWPEPQPIAESRATRRSATSPEAPAIGTLGSVELEQQLRSLPWQFRATLILRDIGNWSYAEIASVLGTTRECVREWISKARSDLCSSLDVLRRRLDLPPQPIDDLR